MIGWLVAYEAMTPGVAVGIEPTVRLNSDNELQLATLSEIVYLNKDTNTNE